MADIIVVKIGGRASQHLDQTFIQELQNWLEQGKSLVLVHGGGYAISQLMDQAHIPVKKVDGLRVTDQAAIKLVEQALVELVGKDICQTLSQAQLPASQLVEQLPALVEADFLDQAKYGYVGLVKEIRAAALAPFLDQGLIPVIPSLGYKDGEILLNINADYLATSLAIALQAQKLVLMTDVAGVKEDGQVLPVLKTQDIQTKIDQGVISGGMIPKVQSAKKTVEAGVKSVVIGDNLLTGTVIDND